jgi:hypothetical protein
MEINVSNIFNTAIILESRTIKKYLIEEQEKSGHSPEVFFGLLLSHIKQISIEKKIENLNGKVLELTYDLKIFDEEVAPTLSDFRRDYNRRKKTEKLEEAKAKATNYKLFDEIVNRLLEKDSLISVTSKASKNQKKTKPKTITIDTDIKNELFDGLKQYFSDKEDELKKLLTEGTISEKLVWPLNQNQLADLFLRLSYNGFIMNDKTEIKNWLVQNFTLANRELNSSSIYETLTRKNEIKKEKRILENLAPFKPKTKII